MQIHEHDSSLIVQKVAVEVDYAVLNLPDCDKLLPSQNYMP